MRAAFLIATLASIAAGLPTAGEEPPTLQGTLVGVADYSGSGCEPGSAELYLTDNSFTADFSTFSAYTTENETSSLKDCSSTMTIAIPDGWKFAPQQVYSEYFAYILDYSNITLVTEVSYAAESTKVGDHIAFTGPGWGSGYTLSNLDTNPLYSPCGGNVNVTMYTQSGVISPVPFPPDEDGDLFEIKYSTYDFTWVKC